MLTIQRVTLTFDPWSWKTSLVTRSMWIKFDAQRLLFFSAPEPKAQVHYCDHALSAVRPSVCLSSVVNFSHIRLLLWNHLTEFKKTWQEARSQRPLPSLCFSGRSEKTRWPPWHLIGWDIFDFSSETAKRNLKPDIGKHPLDWSAHLCGVRLINYRAI